jgi:hypothetical protein
MCETDHANKVLQATQHRCAHSYCMLTCTCMCMYNTLFLPELNICAKMFAACRLRLNYRS